MAMAVGGCRPVVHREREGRLHKEESGPRPETPHEHPFSTGWLMGTDETGLRVCSESHTRWCVGLRGAREAAPRPVRWSPELWGQQLSGPCWVLGEEPALPTLFPEPCLSAVCGKSSPTLAGVELDLVTSRFYFFFF